MMTQINSVVFTQGTASAQSVQSGQNVSGGKSAASKKTQDSQKMTNNLYAGDLNLGNSSDEIENKKKQAQKEAMKVISSAFSKELEIDQMVEDNNQKIADRNDENSEYLDQINTIEQRMQKLKDDYGVTDDSQEQQDLELLEKEQGSINDPSNSEYELTDDDKSRLAEIKENGLTEYQDASLENYKFKSYFQGQVDQNNSEIEAYNESNRAIHMARLKTHPMVDAQKASDQVLESANAEIKGMVVDAAKDHIDDVIEEKEETASEQKQEKEEQEQRIQKAKDNNQTAETDSDEDEDDAEQDEELEQAAQVGDTIIEAHQQVDEMLKKMKLTLEDVKGIEVDSNL